MSYNAASRKDVRRLEKQARLDEAARLATTRTLMATMPGRQWVYEHLTQCHVFASSFSLNAYEAAFKEGERNIGLQLLNDVMVADPDGYVQMMREANVRSTISEQRGSSGTDGGDQGPDEPSGEPAGDPDTFAEAD